MNKLIILLLIILIAYAFREGWFSSPKNGSKTKELLAEMLKEVKRCRELLEKIDSSGSRAPSEIGDDNPPPLLG